MNGPLIFEENEMQTMSDEELEKSNNLIIPCINDDAFIDKKELEEHLTNFRTLIQKYINLIQHQKKKYQKRKWMI